MLLKTSGEKARCSRVWAMCVSPCAMLAVDLSRRIISKSCKSHWKLRWLKSQLLGMHEVGVLAMTRKTAALARTKAG